LLNLLLYNLFIINLEQSAIRLEVRNCSTRGFSQSFLKVCCSKRDLLTFPISTVFMPTFQINAILVLFWTRLKPRNKTLGFNVPPVCIHCITLPSLKQTRKDLFTNNPNSATETDVQRNTCKLKDSLTSRRRLDLFQYVHNQVVQVYLEVMKVFFISDASLFVLLDEINYFLIWCKNMYL
jgi:hypothetical protein